MLVHGLRRCVTGNVTTIIISLKSIIYFQLKNFYAHIITSVADGFHEFKTKVVYNEKCYMENVLCALQNVSYRTKVILFVKILLKVNELLCGFRQNAWHVCLLCVV